MQDREGTDKVVVENLALMRRYAEAMRARKYEIADQLLAYGCVLHITGNHPLAGEHRGPDVVAKFAAEHFQRTGVRMQMVAVVDVLAGVSHGALLLREKASKGERTLEFDRMVLYRFSDGRISELWVYDSQQKALDDLAWRDATA